MEDNTYFYKNITVIRAGIWGKETFLRIKDLKACKDGIMVEETDKENQEAIKAITITEILNNSRYKEIDILKLNIEGAEYDVFSRNYEEWLPKVNQIIIDIHDRKIPGCKEVFYSAINKYNFKEIEQRDNLYFFVAN